MTKKMIPMVCVAAAGICLLAGCADTAFVRRPPTDMHPHGEVVQADLECPPQTELISTGPGPDHVWTSGHWTYANDRWIWIPGH